MATGPFTPRTLIILGATAGLAFAGYLALSIFGDLLGPTGSAGPHAFSRSAIGHRAFLEILQDLDFPAVIGRRRSGRRVGNHGLLVVAEPAPTFQGGVMTATMTDQARDTLVVLPKHWVPYDARDGDTVTGSRLFPEKQVATLLSHLDLAGDVRRDSGPVLLTRTPWPGLAIDIDDLQTIRSDDLTPVVATGNGIVFGALRTGGRTVWVLSDPDLIANHGLGRGDNGVLAVRLVEHAYQGGPIVIDETIHGFALDPSFARQLFKPPLAAATYAGLAAIAVFLWAAALRFGPPLRRRDAIGAGKDGLIENTAHLLDYGGYHASIARRYALGLVADAARRLHVPANTVGAARIAWLDRVGEARHTGERLQTLMAELDRLSQRGTAGRHAATALANRFYRWKRELTDGTGADS